MLSLKLRETERKLVTVLQPYVPEYRVPFFDALATRLQERDLQLVVAHGEPGLGQAARGDARSGTWSFPLATKQVSVRGHNFAVRPVFSLARRSQVVVAELVSTNLDTWLLALTAGSRLALWGHGKSYVRSRSRIDERLELALARRASTVMTYTHSGAIALQQRGYPLERITVLNNSTDTTRLRVAREQITPGAAAEFARAYGLVPGSTVLFVGSLDASKRVDLLIQATKLAQCQLPHLKLIISGAGPQLQTIVRVTDQLPFVEVLPRADPEMLAMLSVVSSLLVIPGRIGLVAVDALTLGLPVLTTDYPFHAPEAEYLDDSTCVRTTEDAEGLAAEMVSLLRDPHRLFTMANAAREAGEKFGVEQMADSFLRGLKLGDVESSARACTPVRSQDS